MLMTVLGVDGKVLAGSTTDPSLGHGGAPQPRWWCFSYNIFKKD